MSVVDARHCHVLVMRDAPLAWFGTISERTGAPGQTQPLGSVETQAGPAAVLHQALARILQGVGIALPARQAAEVP